MSGFSRTACGMHWPGRPRFPGTLPAASDALDRTRQAGEARSVRAFSSGSPTSCSPPRSALGRAWDVAGIAQGTSRREGRPPAQGPCGKGETERELQPEDQRMAEYRSGIDGCAVEPPNPDLGEWLADECQADGETDRRRRHHQPSAPNSGPATAPLATKPM